MGLADDLRRIADNTVTEEMKKQQVLREQEIAFQKWLNDPNRFRNNIEACKNHIIEVAKKRATQKEYSATFFLTGNVVDVSKLNEYANFWVEENVTRTGEIYCNTISVYPMVHWDYYYNRFENDDNGRYVCTDYARGNVIYTPEVYCDDLKYHESFKSEEEVAIQNIFRELKQALSSEGFGITKTEKRVYNEPKFFVNRGINCYRNDGNFNLHIRIIDNEGNRIFSWEEQAKITMNGVVVYFTVSW